MTTSIPHNKERVNYLKQLHNLELSIIPIEPNAKVPLLIKRQFSINNPFITIKSDEEITDGKVSREYRMKRKRYIYKPMSWPTIKKYIKQDCNFALLTGQETVNGEFTAILDFDLKGENKELKYKLFSEWLAKNPEFENYPMHQTPSGGYQFVFFSPYEIKKQNMYLSGIHIGEILADGAYGLLPYSTIDNNAYTSINSLIDHDIPVIDIHSIDLEFDYLYNNNCSSYCEHEIEETTVNNEIKHYTIEIKWSKENYYAKVLSNNYQNILHAEIGNRNNTLYEQTRMAFAVARGLNFETKSIEKFKQAAIKAGLEENEVNATFESAKKADNTVEVIFKGLSVYKQWREKEQYREQLGSSIEAFEWFRTHICRTIKGNGILQEEFKQGYLSSTTGQQILGDKFGVSRFTVGRWIKEWIANGWCIKVSTKNGWCYRFGEIISGVIHWFIDKVYSLEVPELKIPVLTDKNESVFLINKDFNYARGPDLILDIKKLFCYNYHTRSDSLN